MKIALIQQHATSDLDANERHGVEAARRAAAEGAELVAFPELAFTPFYPQKPPAGDVRALAESVPGPTTEVFQASGPPSARHTAPRSPPDAPEVFPLAVGKWWLYEERVASGDLVATERWKVRARHADAFVLTTRQ